MSTQMKEQLTGSGRGAAAILVRNALKDLEKVDRVTLLADVIRMRQEKPDAALGVTLGGEEQAILNTVARRVGTDKSLVARVAIRRLLEKMAAQ